MLLPRDASAPPRAPAVPCRRCRTSPYPEPDRGPAAPGRSARPVGNARAGPGVPTAHRTRPPRPPDLVSPPSRSAARRRARSRVPCERVVLGPVAQPGACRPRPAAPVPGWLRERPAAYRGADGVRAGGWRTGPSRRTGRPRQTWWAQGARPVPSPSRRPSATALDRRGAREDKERDRHGSTSRPDVAHSIHFVQRVKEWTACGGEPCSRRSAARSPRAARPR